MKKYSLELQVGLFVLVGFLCLGYLTIKLGKMELFSSHGHTFEADFSSVAGLRIGAGVEICGVSVGKVTSISLLPEENGARITMNLNETVHITDDTIASIKTSGIIGDKYVSLSIGGGSALAAGGRITETEASIDLESLISKYVFGGVK